MAVSKLATYSVPAYEGNYTKNRASVRWNDKTQERTYGTDGTPSSITMVTIHMMAGIATSQACGRIFQAIGRGGSSHYGIGNGGDIAWYVDENDVAWTNSNYYSNCHAVTIETSNCKMGGDWPVSDQALASLIKLTADIAKRNKLGKLVPGQNLTWHCMYAATSCPGKYLLSKMQYIADEANKINDTSTSTNTNTNTNGKKTPAQIAAEWPNNRYVVSGTDKARYTDELIVYTTKKKTTGTNQWGYEILVDKNGVCISEPEYKGNHTIPEGGKVISGHGKAGEWIKKNMQMGNQCWIKEGVLYVDKKQYRTITSINGTRWTNYLCVYTNGGKTTGTNKWGIEVAVDKNGIITTDPQTAGNMKIPVGGFVLSGHGAACDWIKTYAKKGKKLILNNIKTVVHFE